MAATATTGLAVAHGGGSARSLNCSAKSMRRSSFVALRSTEENHRADCMEFFGAFAHLRSKLDYTYHANYTRERQRLQDSIMREFLEATVLVDVYGNVGTTPTQNWLVFTAGAMGAGKGYAVDRMVAAGHFPLTGFVSVDPDEVRRRLPEFALYAEMAPERAGDLTQKEAGYVAEILTAAALEAERNVLVDGSLRDTSWYEGYFAELRAQNPRLQIAIIHVTAPREAVFARAAERARRTGRVVPRELLVAAMEQVPRSVRVLAPPPAPVDYFCEIHNAPGQDLEITTEGEDWDTFQCQWFQSLAFVVGQQTKRFSQRRNPISRSASAVEGEPAPCCAPSCAHECGSLAKVAARLASEAQSETSSPGEGPVPSDVPPPAPLVSKGGERDGSEGVRRRWQAAEKAVVKTFRVRQPRQACCIGMSTTAIHGAPPEDGLFGIYAEIRGEMGHAYHGNYKKQRQWLQDAIVADVLRMAVMSSPSDAGAGRPWLVLVAGAMGSGKLHTVRELARRGRLRLGEFVFVDPEMVRQDLPEYDLIVETCPDSLEIRTNQEVRFLDELLIRTALRAGQSVVVSLEVTQPERGRVVLEQLRGAFPALAVALLHVTGDRDTVLRRAADVASASGRAVDELALEASLARAPLTARALGPLADYVCELRNDDGLADGAEIATEGETWDTFSSRWAGPTTGR